MSVVDKIVDGVTDKLLDLEGFKDRDLDEVFGESLNKEGTEDSVSITDFRNQEAAVEELGLSVDDVYNAVTLKRGEALKSTPRISVIQEVMQVSSALEGVASGVNLLKSDEVQRKDKEDKEDKEKTEQLAVIEKEDKVERKKAVARSEKLGALIKKHSTATWFDKIKNKILPFLLAIGVLSAFKDKIVEILSPVWESIKEWVKNNFPRFYGLLTGVRDVVIAISDAIRKLADWLVKAVVKLSNGINKIIKWASEVPSKIKGWVTGKTEDEGYGGSTSPTGGFGYAGGGVGGGSREGKTETSVDDNEDKTPKRHRLLRQEEIDRLDAEPSELEPSVVIASREKEQDAVVEGSAEPSIIRHRLLSQEELSDEESPGVSDTGEDFGQLPQMDVEAPKTSAPTVVQNNQTSVSSVNYHTSVDVYNVQQ